MLHDGPIQVNISNQGTLIINIGHDKYNITENKYQH